MLTANGILLIIKKIIHVFGYDEHSSRDLDFSQTNDENALTAPVSAFNNIKPNDFIIAIVSLIILIARNKIKISSLRSLHAALIVAFVDVAINPLFYRKWNAFSQEHLLTIQVLGQDTTFENLFLLPDWFVLNQPVVYTTTISAAFLARLETLLSVEAIDKLAPQKVSAIFNREMKAHSIGNIPSSPIMGLPMTAVIERDPLNINEEAKTKISRFLHAVHLVIAILLIPKILNMIPYASLIPYY